MSYGSSAGDGLMAYVIGIALALVYMGVDVPEVSGWMLLLLIAAGALLAFWLESGARRGRRRRYWR